MASEMELYWISGSSPCWSAMIALEEKGLQGYKSHMISSSKKEHKSEPVLAINPRGQVPTFKHGNNVVNESAGICDYVEASFKSQGTVLYPSDPAQLAKVLQRKYETVNLQKKVMMDYLYPHFIKADNLDKEEMKKKEEASAEVSIWDSYLKETSGGFLAGPEFSMADVMFFPMLAFFVRMGAPVETKFPHLNSYYNMVKERASIQASWPPHWKDSPNQTLLADF